VETTVPKKSNTLIVAGGGTGGHIWAGVAIADAWKKKWGESSRIIFVGGRGGLEERLVPKAGYPLSLIGIGPLKRVSLKQRITTFAQIPISLFKCLFWTLKERPEAVIGVGGYASGPMVLMASLFSKTAILEQNSIPGFTNRVLGRFVAKVFCAFPDSIKSFTKTPTFVSGNPIRVTLTEMAPAPRDPFTIFIFGGSRGALGINELVMGALDDLSRNHPNEYARMRWIHQTGPLDLERVSQAHQKFAKDKAHHEVSPFIDDMPSKYRQASLIVCRAGASTLAELAAVGRASIMVPLPTAADNHQEVNARIYERQGACIVLKQGQAKGTDLAKQILELMRQPEKISKMESVVKNFYRPKAADDIVAELTR